jgi:glyoxylase-like metal-dependent hydrolase (beta-lactamase superfamily II)
MCAPFDTAPRPTLPSLAGQIRSHPARPRGAVADSGPRPVRPGIWCVPVPVPRGLVTSTLVYAIETEKGPVLIDAGSDDDASWNVLVSGLAACGLDVHSVYGIVLTHAHSDHHGLSGRVRECSGAWIAMHGLDARLLASTGYMGPDWPGRLANLLAYCGAPAADQAATSGMRRADLVPPDRVLADGDKVDVPGWQLTAIWTPGHTPGHLCYRIDESGLLFSGDHALPTISSRVGVAEYDGASDALGDMLVSLDRAAELDTSAVWPGHEFEFGAGQYRGRCHELLTRQQEQLRQAARVLERGPATAWAVAEALGRQQRSFDALEPGRRRLIVLEVLARLQHLQATGATGLRVCDGMAIFSLTERPTG